MVFWLLQRRSSRRWFRFSMRTMLILVTGLSGFLGWLGWELKYVRERQQWILANQALIRPMDPIRAGWSKEGEPTYDTTRSVVDGVYLRARTDGVPSWRIWLGDEPVPSIVLPVDSRDHERVKALFPETVIAQELRFKKK